jgi:hypothetical protein
MSALPEDIAEALVTTRRDVNEAHRIAQESHGLTSDDDRAWSNYHVASRRWSEALLMMDAWIKSGSVC